MLKKLFFILLFSAISSIAMATDTTIIHVHFEFDTYQLNDKAITQIQQFSTTKKQYDSIFIYGHTDQIGSYNYNNILSLKRAITVKNELYKQGIDTNKIFIVEGMGESNLLTHKQDAASRALNRRVEIMAFTIKKNEPEKTTVKKDTIKKEKPTEKPVTLTEKIKDTTTKEGDNLILRNINFEGGRHVFLRQSYSALNELLSAMQNIPTLIIQIEGHICCQTLDEDGLDLDTRTKDLSVRRAKAVYDFLKQNGIEAKRMSYQGFARKFPLTKETDEYEKMLNRRVEIKIIRK
ncbi:MAG: OmpA family protein [Chitinophagaceae bacterium]|nr:OmpA family protein [Chitinophagaceae bacterium]MCW5904849.1 OmpA family protein [Chitinophagaceae bacterium]